MWSKAVKAVVEVPFEFVKHQMVRLLCDRYDVRE